MEGRLCAAAYVHNSQAYTVRALAAILWYRGARCALACAQDCTSASNPDGISGRDWCYVEDLDSLHVDAMARIEY